MNRPLIAVLPMILSAAAAHAGEVRFDTPSDDRWHYPFNPNPGGRATASCFGSTADPNFTTFNDRDGIFLIAWRTDDFLCSGLPPESYEIQSIRVTLTTPPEGADWPIDLTPDPWFNMVYPITDSDPGQPLELYGMGFGPEFTPATWDEQSFYVGGDHEFFSPRDPFPFVFHATTGANVHVEDSVTGQFTPTPWAIGVPVAYTPGRQTVPFSVNFDLGLSQSGGRVRRYFQDQLSSGRVFVAVTSLTVTSEQAPSGFPTFFTKEGAAGNPDGRAPVLIITLVPSGDLDGNARRDLEDWSALADCLSGPGQLPSPAPPLTPDVCLCLFDFDEDEDVDLQDINRFQRRFDGGN